MKPPMSLSPTMYQVKLIGVYAPIWNTCPPVKWPARISERFFERAQIHVLRPRRALLAMDVPIGVGGGAGRAVLATFLAQGRRPTEQPIAVDPAVDHHMRHVNPERPV